MSTGLVKVFVDSSLRVDTHSIDDDLAGQIRSYLTIVNARKVEALKRGDFGAEDMIDSFDLWSHDGPDLVMPRGFAHVLRSGVENSGGRVEWVDHTVAPPVPLRQLAAMRAPQLLPDQEMAALALLEHRQGVFKSPTAGGKTVVGLDVWRRAGVTGIIYVNKIGLAQQWRDRALEHLGIETGFIGDGIWEERPLTIAMVQTVHSRRYELDRDGWWERWGLTDIDEAHHAPADTYQDILRRTLSRYLFGKTATPLDGDWLQPVLVNSIGPIVHETTDEDLHRTGRRIMPIVRVMKTPFHWDPTTAADRKLVDSRAIYRRIINALVDDPRRMGLIVTTIMDQPSSCAQLVLCKRLEYLERMRMRLMQAGYDQDRIFFYRGAESRARKGEVAAAADEGRCVILASAADEGTDIPRLDRLHLTWPARKALTITQQAGRVLRTHDQKMQPIIFDYADVLQSVLRSQFYARVNDVYRPRGWAIEFVDHSIERVGS